MTVQAARKTEVDSIIERLLALADGPSRAELVTQNPAVAWAEAVTTLTEKVWQEVRIDTHLAKRLADAALDVARAIGNPSLLAKSLRSKANALYALDEHTAAVGNGFDRADPVTADRAALNGNRAVHHSLS